MNQQSVLFIHDKIKISGGDTVYIYQLIESLPSYGWGAYLMVIKREGDLYKIYFPKSEPVSIPINNFKFYLKAFCEKNHIRVINIQTCWDPSIKKICLDVLPVIKTIHSADSVCPGRGKFWRNSGRICEVSFGLKCLYHIYKEKCANRHPKNIMDAFQDIYFEKEVGANNYAKIITFSSYVKNESVKLGVEEEKVIVNPCFTEHVESIPALTFPDKNFNMLFVGRLNKAKGVTFMLAALKPLILRYSHISLDIVGDGIDRDEVEKFIITHKMENRLKLHGWLSHDMVQERIRSSDLVLFPSIYPEAFGIVGLEAMMNAKPVVAFDVGGVSTWLTHGETGLMVKVKDIEAYRNAVESLLIEPKIYLRMAKKARELALSKFLPKYHINALIEIYQSCMRPSEVLLDS